MRPSRRAVVAGLSALGLLPVCVRGATTPVEAKFVIEDGRLWVSASVNGSEPLLFIVDTGAASNFLRPEIAKKLKLVVQGTGSVGGVGGRNASTGVVMAREIAIGGAFRQNRVLFNTYDMARGFPDDAAGMFASGLFTTLDTDLDFANGVWRIWPKGRNGDPRGAKLADSSITLMGGRGGSQRMYATIQIDGRPYRMGIDTGAPGALFLFPRAAARSGLFEGRPYAPSAVSGFGGRAKKLGRIVRAERLNWGPLSLKRPFVSLMDPTETALFDFDGLIGLPLISLFDMATEAGPGKIWLARNALKPTADPYGRSGLWIGSRDKEIAVEAVGTGSPAYAAGVRAGDVLVAPKDFGEAIKLINGSAGQEIALSFRRDGAVVERRMTLSDYL